MKKSINSKSKSKKTISVRLVIFTFLTIFCLPFIFQIILQWPSIDFENLTLLQLSEGYPILASFFAAIFAVIATIYCILYKQYFKLFYIIITLLVTVFIFQIVYLPITFIQRGLENQKEINLQRQVCGKEDGTKRFNNDLIKKQKAEDESDSVPFMAWAFEPTPNYWVVNCKDGLFSGEAFGYSYSEELVKSRNYDQGIITKTVDTTLLGKISETCLVNEDTITKLFPFAESSLDCNY